MADLVDDVGKCYIYYEQNRQTPQASYGKTEMVLCNP